MKTIKAKEGKVFRRIVDKVLFGNEVHLGYLYHLHGEVLKVPILELPEHFEQIDEPITEDSIVIDEYNPLVEELPEEIIEEEVKEPRKITVAEYMALEEKVEQLMQMLNGRTE